MKARSAFPGGKESWDGGHLGIRVNEDAAHGMGDEMPPALAAGRTYWWKVQLWNRRNSAEIARITPYQSEEMITELHKSRSGPFSEPSSFTVRSRR